MFKWLKRGSKENEMRLAKVPSEVVERMVWNV